MFGKTPKNDLLSRLSYHQLHALLEAHRDHTDLQIMEAINACSGWVIQRDFGAAIPALNEMYDDICQGKFIADGAREQGREILSAFACTKQDMPNNIGRHHEISVVLGKYQGDFGDFKALDKHHTKLLAQQERAVAAYRKKAEKFLGELFKAKGKWLSQCTGHEAALKCEIINKLQ
jgi:hypothetical protein